MDLLPFAHRQKFDKDKFLRECLLGYAKRQKIQKKVETKKKRHHRKRKTEKKFAGFGLLKSLNFGKKTANFKSNKIYQLLSDIVVSFFLTFKNYTIHVFFSLLLSALIFAGTYWAHEEIFKDLPSPSDLVQKDQIVSTKIFDRNGEILFKLYEDENRTIVPLSAIPQSLINATIAIEDKDFYNHHGFSIRGISRAIIANINGEELQGGSTLTQQLVKNRLLTPKRTFSRKIKELLLSILVEGTFTKDEILEMYLNQVAYGGSTYGVEEAAQKYFDKHVQDLSLAESAMLAGLPRAPSVYSPFGPNPELAFTRQEEVLRRMVEDGYILEETSQRARKESLTFNKSKIEIEAPHFVMYVKKILAQKYGEDLLNNGGLEVTTTLDLETQKKVEEVVEAEISKLERLRVGNGAAMVTNPQTGEVLAMVGSVNYFDFENDGQVNVALRPRQPGSSIKPINYALALTNGKTPSTVINDSPITYHTLGSKPYSPQNYDGKYHGNVTLRNALASSYNVPAVKLLAENGVSNMIDLGEEMGISTWTDRSRFGLSLTLGGGEVTMLDMTEVYGTFANGGKHVETNPILEVKDYKGKIYYQNDCVLNNFDCSDGQVLSEQVAFLISDILSDNQARTPAFGPMSTLHIPGQQVAVKTGTTNNLRDNWTFGFTSDRLVSVWVGNNDNTPMSYVASGITGATPIWNEIMRSQLSEESPHKFEVPSGIVQMRVCAISTNIPCSQCPLIKNEYFVSGTEPKYSCLSDSPSNNQNNNQQIDSPNRDRILNGISF